MMNALRCQPRRRTTTARKLSLAIWFLVIWFCLKSLAVMYISISSAELDDLGDNKIIKYQQDKNQDEWHSAVERYDVITLARISLTQFNGYVSKSEKLCWCILFLSILTETGATTLSKYASDLSSPTLLAMSCVLVILSQCGLTISLAKIDVGVAYAMWAAVGTAAVSISAMVLFAEDFDLMKVGCLLMIIVGVAGLNLRDSH